MFSIPQFFFAAWVMVVSLQMHGYRSCIEKERKGLLDLKAYVNQEYSYDWSNDTKSDCCRWERVECDRTSGLVIGLFLNQTFSDPIRINLSLFHPFEELQSLNLYDFGCTGWFDDIHGYKSLGKLKKLEILDIGNNKVNNIILPFLNAASSLKTLILHGNNMEGNFPMKELKDLRNLELLDLSGNFLIGPVPGLAVLHKLHALDLSDNTFSGSLGREGLCQLKNLQELDLSQNEFIGPFPQCFSSLTKLQVLDMSSNQFNGTLPSVISNLDSLEYLSLSDNKFEGFFSFDLIANLSKLKVFKLSSKVRSLHIESEISLQLKFRLSVIDLQYCNLETVPSFLQQQKDLRLINLSNNKLTGISPSWFLVNYPKLRVLLLWNNSFTTFHLPRLLVHSLHVLDLSINKFDEWLPKDIGHVLPNISHLNLSNNGFQGNLPSSFSEMKKIFFLDLSHNNFSGSLPKKFCIGCSSLSILKLSYNRFSGQIFPQPMKLESLDVLIADNNQFTGIGDGLIHSKGLKFLELSNNSLQGVIPSWFGGFYFLYLSVSDNLLNGTIPSTLFNVSFQLLDLSRNKFSGNLPSHFNSRHMGLLYLHDNEFSGPVPSTLLENVMLLDLRNNKLSGTIPRFVSNRYVLYLLLRGNTLTGHIPTSLCEFKSIRVLDLANNRLNGLIPSCLNNVSFGRSLDYEIDPEYGSSYAIVRADQELEEAYSRSLVLPLEFELDYSGYLDFTVEFTSKRRYDSYMGESFKFMFGLDFSSNELIGEIPRELGDFQRMRALNLSRNSLSGLVPESFSNLTDIESIDLSFNVLHGSIPHDLTKLDYLVVFNVSYNNLSGSIPTQGKFFSLSETNYIGNPFLCGTAINKRCDDDNTTGFKETDSPSGDDERAIDMETFYWSLIATYSITWMALIVFLCFDSPWRQEWFRLVNAFHIYVMVMDLMVMVTMIMMMVSSLDAHGHRSCIESERKGLLELKAYLNISEYPYDWPNDTNSDCCKWERVKCDLTSGRVIGLSLIDTCYPPPLLNLSLFYPFGELQTLNLRNLWCQGWFDHIHGYKSFERLKNLEILDLSENGVSNTVLPFLNSASSLKTLILHGNNMEDLANFHNLQGLDLSDNKFSGSLDNKGLCQLKKLRELDLSQNKFTGQFPMCFDSLTQLQVLDISSNQFNGTVPSLIRNLDSIEYLALSDNEFEGFFSFELIANLSKLKVFKLSSRSNLLHLKKLPSLQPKFQLSIIELQNCNLENVPSFIQHQKDLRVINLSNNKLTGTFPFWLLEKYPNLRVLLLQNNSLTILELPRLLNHSLQILDLSANSFDQPLPENIGKVLPNIKHLNLSNNGFQWKLPSSFSEMKDIKFLDLSHNNFSGSLPMKFLIGCYSLHTLKLSYNKFFGQILPKPTNFGSLVVLIANNNLFTVIADGLLNSKSLGVLDLSNNYLQGVIPSWFGGFFFAYLFLSNNLLEGTLPSTLFNIPTFKILDLSGNKFSGNLPSQLNGMNTSLLYLNDNEFSGTIPSTLIKDVLVLDLRNNKLSGTIPHFVKNEFILSLLLRGNTLTGYIPTDLCGLRSIRILDLANNRLKGSIPSCLNNVSFGRRLDYEVNGDKLPFEINDDEELAVYSRLLVLPREYSSDYTGILMFNVEFASKSRYDSYTQESFNFMFGLDMSSNELNGEIPKELGDLQRIRALNLSHNSLSGLIPESFSNLTDIESIDLSFNLLRGPIPQDLSKLDYMVVFNVSYNNLSGSIPSQGKFSTLDGTNYIGNTLLCGSAINRSCDDNSTTGFLESDAQSEDEETTIDMKIFYWSLAATCGMHGCRSCIETERKGLLEFKAYGNFDLPYDWPNHTDSDCCRWERVKCDLTSGRVIGLLLNYTFNVPPLNLSLLYPFGELQILNLTNFWCTEWFDDIHGYKSLGRLKKLEILDFSYNGVNNSVLPFLNAASSLKILILHGNFIEGTFPMKELKDLRNLKLLDMSENMFHGPIPGLANLHKLEALDLSDNQFSGSLEKQGLCLLKDLRELDLSGNRLVGQLPSCFGSLTKLQILDLSSNQLNGTVPSLIGNLTSLEYLSLSDNVFEGILSFNMIANLSKLKVFKLSSRSNLLQIETEISWQPRFQLNVIELQYCNLETVPSLFQHQKYLRLINLSNNKLSGVFPSWFLVQYPKLEVLLLKNNSFTILQFPRLVHRLHVLDVSTNGLDGKFPENIGNVLPNLRHLNLSSNEFQGNLSSSLGEMKMLQFLDISHNNLSGNLPRKFLMGCASLQFFKLSHNKFSGQLFSAPTNLKWLTFLIADNNQFTRISDGLLHSKWLSVLDMSNNNLQGIIPNWLGDFFFTFLLASGNLLEGTIPSTLFNMRDIKLLDLSRNKFSGTLPPHFNGSRMSLLFLNDNELSGPIPGTLLENLMVLDLRNNKLSGNIPWFFNNRYVRSLLLRGNKLTGHIPTNLCGLRSINILDLAYNSLNGFIPSCLNNISFGRSLEYEVDGYGLIYVLILDNELGTYHKSLVLPYEFDPDYSRDLNFIVEFSSKSRYDSYTGESFDFMFGLDLSSNEFSGHIPRELGDLQRIRALNLSHNSLSGIIPESFSNLTDIESLDLSFNMLHGPIPYDLTKLDYLGRVLFTVALPTPATGKMHYDRNKQEHQRHTKIKATANSVE
ncbi:Leucine-rich repeat [Arabidopsis suecica]|uniref:Leucine-rich repeat n=1 Tax=Arabidopsis suecica TaxID=45249 RepID=A0A8T2BQS9_ARASU|nr:Leucine-rich repeat [Arabidopsis suecica]